MAQQFVSQSWQRVWQSPIKMFVAVEDFMDLYGDVDFTQQYIILNKKMTSMIDSETKHMSRKAEKKYIEEYTAAKNEESGKRTKEKSALLDIVEKK